MNKPCVPLWVWPALLLLLLSGIHAARIEKEGTVTAVVATRELRAFHRITGEDLEVKKLRRQDRRMSVFKTAEEVQGRVARVVLKKGKPVEQSQVTKPVADSLYAERVPVAFKSERSSSWQVAPGDQVQLLLAPTGDDHELPAGVIDALLVDLRKGKGATVEYVVAVKLRDRSELLSLVGRSQLLVAPVVQAA